MKKVLIAVLSIFLIFVALAGLLVWSVLSDHIKTSSDINLYTQLVENEDNHPYAEYMPSLDELGEYESLDFYYYHKTMFVFHSDAYTLKVTYDEGEFETEKEKVLNNYSYRRKIPLREEKELKKDPEFHIDTFEFKLLSTPESDAYPKELTFIGISEETNEIAYVYYYDQDLDYIDTTFEEFLKNECGYVQEKSTQQTTEETVVDMITEVKAKDMLREKFGDGYGYYSMEPEEIDGDNYYVIDLKQNMGNYSTHITYYFVSTDGSQIIEGGYDENGEPELFD